MFQLGIAAAAAGAATSYVLTPIELIKCRMQVQMIAKEQAALTTSSASGGPASASAAIRSLPGPVTLARQVIASEGITGLWLGQTGTLLRETGGGIAWFLAFEATCREFLARRSRTNRPDQKSDLSSIELVTAGAAAGIGYNVILFPADCIKSTIQTEKELKPNQPIAGFLQTGTRIYRQRGIRGLYAGCGITCLRSAPSSALIL
ncbi:Mitochondrial carnitine-acylcarnitine carrier protein [Ceraceosorus bombacis]|uniref:Mitochondrial carnitine-acylcarnitine carrier protein n=1 Tax=Ceraceosorus bombacis TaxID=401625 RepID=A0A0P1BG39_9BASI|nr:Mitochondrial carnitine-acylcarnitine carrier protein [Ceraceosorus bombacis]